MFDFEADPVARALRDRLCQRSLHHHVIVAVVEIDSGDVDELPLRVVRKAIGWDSHEVRVAGRIQLVVGCQRIDLHDMDVLFTSEIQVVAVMSKEENMWALQSDQTFVVVDVADAVP